VAQGVQYDPPAQLTGLPTTRSAGDPARRIVAQAARVAGAGTCCRTNLVRGTTLGGRSPGSSRWWITIPGKRSPSRWMSRCPDRVCAGCWTGWPGSGTIRRRFGSTTDRGSRAGRLDEWAHRRGV